jgi:hypothetical protein
MDVFLLGCAFGALIMLVLPALVGRISQADPHRITETSNPDIRYG